jgi:hypothetical protein
MSKDLNTRAVIFNLAATTACYPITTLKNPLHILPEIFAFQKICLAELVCVGVIIMLEYEFQIEIGIGIEYHKSCT